MNNILKIGIGAACLSPVCGSFAQVRTDNVRDERPNVIVILIDDAGYADFGFMGSEDFQTPNIDRLAAAGTVFSDAHVSATVSSPSRAGLLTGRYGQRFGFEANPPVFENGLPLSETTMADVLKENGYATAAIGKWHLGSLDSQHPNERGFDLFYGMKAGMRNYFYDPEGDDRPGHVRSIMRNGRQEKFDGYLTDVFSEEAAGFIRQSDKPFFIYLSYNAVHTPMQAPQEDLDRFEGHPRQKLAAMTWALDRGVGTVVEALEETGKYDNTLIFFLSDNGGAIGQYCNLPLKGFKGNKFEGGHRVPFFVTWGGRLKSAGTFDGLSSSLDIFPTSLDAAGISYRPEEGIELDGVSLIPYIKGVKCGAPHDRLFWRSMDSHAVRNGEYKLIITEGVDTVFYNMRTDLSEMKNIRLDEPAKFEESLKLLREWEEDCAEPSWGKKGSGRVRYHELLMRNLIYESKDMKDIK